MNMNILKNIAVVIFLLFFSLSCSVISSEVRNDAMAPMPFKTLVQNAGEYAGQTVILGGYYKAPQGLKLWELVGLCGK